jgi:hypothetical protein
MSLYWSTPASGLLTAPISPATDFCNAALVVGLAGWTKSQVMSGSPTKGDGLSWRTFGLLMAGAGCTNIGGADEGCLLAGARGVASLSSTTLGEVSVVRNIEVWTFGIGFNEADTGSDVGLKIDSVGDGFAGHGAEELREGLEARWKEIGRGFGLELLVDAPPGPAAEMEVDEKMGIIPRLDSSETGRDIAEMGRDNAEVGRGLGLGLASSSSSVLGKFNPSKTSVR